LQSASIGRLAGADRTADADAEGAVLETRCLNSLVYWVSCFIERVGARGAPRSSASLGCMPRVASTSGERGDDLLRRSGRAARRDRRRHKMAEGAEPGVERRPEDVA
jgi:hypothetical protein